MPFAGLYIVRRRSVGEAMVWHLWSDWGKRIESEENEIYQKLKTVAGQRIKLYIDMASMSLDPLWFNECWDVIIDKEFVVLIVMHGFRGELPGLRSHFNEIKNRDHVLLLGGGMVVTGVGETRGLKLTPLNKKIIISCE